jgi:4-hydroxy-4-methyl-2-oxoglutarate aldolase
MTKLPLDDLRTALVGNARTRCRVLGPFESATLAAHCAGPALTVAGTGGDNLALYRTLAAATPGDVLVIGLDGSRAAGHWGSLMTQAAQRAGIAGVVIDGAIRDRVEVAELGLPVFFRGSFPLTAAKQVSGEIGTGVAIDGIEIASGDLIVADSDAVVAVHPDDVDELRTGASEVLVKEERISARLRDGDGLGTAFGIAGVDQSTPRAIPRTR